jgi:hypothetical protein
MDSTFCYSPCIAPFDLPINFASIPPLFLNRAPPKLISVLNTLYFLLVMDYYFSCCCCGGFVGVGRVEKRREDTESNERQQCQNNETMSDGPAKVSLRGDGKNNNIIGK